MTRRLLRVCCALVAVGSLASCATFDETDRVATVNGKELTEDVLAEMLESAVGNELLQSSPIEGVATGDSVRGLISAWAGLNALDDAGIIDESSRTAAREQNESIYGELWSSTPPEMQDLAVLNRVIGGMVQARAVTPAQLEAAVEVADISVSPRYGRWDTELLGVVPLN